VKQYPEIQSSVGQKFREIPGAYVFDKIDGSNLRFEWSRKSGWYKYGTRNRLFDKSDQDFGESIKIFENSLAEPLERISRDHKWDNITVYCEYWGINSFAGVHVPEKHHLTLFDVNVYKKGFIGPKDFLKIFNIANTQKFLGVYNWTRGFVEKVRNNEIEGITFEGVVGKYGEGHNLTMAKAKTQCWIDKVKSLYPENAKSIIES